MYCVASGLVNYQLVELIESLVSEASVANDEGLPTRAVECLEALTNSYSSFASRAFKVLLLILLSLQLPRDLGPVGQTAP